MCKIYDDGDGVTLWRRKPVTARKRHKCASCSATIEVGDAHNVHRWLYEGSWDACRECYVCWLAREEFEDAHDTYIHPSATTHFLSDCIDHEELEGDESSAAKWQSVLDLIYANSERRRTGAIAAPELCE